MSRIKLTSRPVYFLFFLAMAPATAWSQVDLSRAVSFGDSLSDNDSLFLLFGTDPAIYGADPFESAFNRASGPDDSLTSYAVLGSTSEDVLGQVIDYTISRWLGREPRATLVSLQAGGNDFLTEEILLTLATAPPGVNASVDRLVNRIQRNLLKSVLLVRFVDRNASVVVWTVPDVTLTPFVLSLGLDRQSMANVQLHINRLNQGIRQLQRQRRIAVLDIASVLTAVSIDPPTIDGITLTPTPFFGFGSAVFADPIHPTAVANGLLANELIETLNARFDDDIPPYTEAELRELIGPTP